MLFCPVRYACHGDAGSIASIATILVGAAVHPQCSDGPLHMCASRPHLCRGEYNGATNKEDDCQVSTLTP